MKDIITIRYSKSIAYFRIIILIILVLTLFYITFINDSMNWNIYSQYLIIGICLFSLIGLWYHIVKYLMLAIKRVVAINIDKEGITNNINNYIVKWNNVKSIRIVSNFGSSYIAIDLINTKEATGNTTNIFKMISDANNTLLFKTPILISTQFLEVDNKELLISLSSFFDKK